MSENYRPAEEEEEDEGQDACGSNALPDLSPEEAAKVAKSLEDTYGKIYLLWDPGTRTLPTGNPSITVLKTK